MITLRSATASAAEWLQQGRFDTAVSNNLQRWAEIQLGVAADLLQFSSLPFFCDGGGI